MLKSNTTMAIEDFFLLRNISRGALIKGNLSPSLVLERNIKMLGRSVLSKQ
jgi:hypothetical protein